MLGIIWTVLVPAAMAAVYYFVFQKILKTPVDNYLLFILSGLLPWSFFSSSIVIGLESVVGNHSLLSKVPIAPHVFPLSETLTALVNFIFSLPVMIGVMFFSDVEMSIFLFWLLFLMSALIIQAYFFALLLSTLFVFLRDLRHVMAIGMQIWFYLTPVLYDSKMIPPHYRYVQLLNPVGLIFEGFHKVILNNTGLDWVSVLVITVWTTLVVLISTIIYYHNRRIIVERI